MMRAAHTERPQGDDGRRIGPYHLIARLDTAGPGLPPTPERRFIARGGGSARTVIVSAPLDGIDPRRFLTEAHKAYETYGAHESREVYGTHADRPRISPVIAVSPEPAAPWYASPYLPALPLPTALAVHAGPLPEWSVRALGAALAEALTGLHGAGVTHAGLSPAAVLLTADGPLLTCFGAARAAAPDGEPRLGRPGLEPGCLAPELAAGGRPRPPGDIYALGSVLAYAATGHTVPDRTELPDSLRSLVARCLSRDAAARPTAAEVLTTLTGTPPGPVDGKGYGYGDGNAPVATVLDPAPATRVPLPSSRIVAAIARQSADVLATDIALPSSPRI